MGHAHVETINKRSAKVPRQKGKRQKMEVDDADERGSREGLRRVAKYISKGLDHESRYEDLYDEDWVTGQRGVRCCDPRLAVRWELATYRMHLVQRYGKFRKLALDEHGENQPPDNERDEDVSCVSCGTVGNWKRGFRSTYEWFAECHEFGVKALSATPDSWVSLEWNSDPPYEKDEFT